MLIWWKINYWWLKTFWIFAKVKCTSSPGLITRWTLSTHNFCPSGFARSHRKLFFIFKISLLLLSNFNIRSHSWQILTLWSNETWCSWYFTIKGQTPNLMKYFPERENYENLSSKKTPGPLQPSSICKDVPHPRNSLDVLYDSLYTSQVIEKWKQKVKWWNEFGTI